MTYSEPVKRTSIQHESSEVEHDWRTPIERVASLFARGRAGYSSLPTAFSAAARRIDVGHPARMVGTVVPILELAGIDSARMSNERLLRWATMVRTVAILCGTAGHPVASRKHLTGCVLQQCRYSEARLARLLNARGKPLADQMIRLSRFLATAGATHIDLRPLADLVLEDGQPGSRSDEARIRIARSYFSRTAASAEIHLKDTASE